jgi:hypothetical protein
MNIRILVQPNLLHDTAKWEWFRDTDEAAKSRNAQLVWDQIPGGDWTRKWQRLTVSCDMLIVEAHGGGEGEVAGTSLVDLARLRRDGLLHELIDTRCLVLGTCWGGVDAVCEALTALVARPTLLLAATRETSTKEAAVIYSEAIRRFPDLDEGVLDWHTSLIVPA